MRASRAWTVGLAALALVGLGYVRLHAMTLSQENNGQTVDVRVGEDVTVSLRLSQGTGYEWEPLSPKSGVAVMQGAMETQPIPPVMPGSPANELFHYHIQKAGTVTLEFGLLRSWEHKPPAESFKVTLRAR